MTQLDMPDSVEKQQPISPSEKAKTQRITKPTGKTTAKGVGNNKGIFITVAALIVVIGGVFTFLFFNKKIDYAKEYYKHLNAIQFGNEFDWMNAELVDLDHDEIPELVAAYGNQFELNNAYEEEDSDQKTGSVSIFKYNDQEIIEYNEPTVLNFGTIEAVKVSPFKLNTNYSFQGESGTRNKKIYIKDVGDISYLFVVTEVQNDDYLYKVNGYSLTSDGSLTPKIELEYFENWREGGDLQEITYKYNGKAISEEQYNQYIEKYKNIPKGFLISEKAQEDYNTAYGDAISYQLNGANYNYAMNVKTSAESEFLSEKEADSLKEDFSRARQLFNDGKYDESLEICDKILSIDFNSENVLYLKAEILYEKMKYIKANQLLKRLLTVDPDNKEAFQLKSKERNFIFNNKLLKSFVNNAFKTGEFGPFHADLIGQSFDRIKDIYGEPTDVYYADCTDCDDFDEIYYDRYYFSGYKGNSNGLSVYVEDMSVNELVRQLGQPDDIEDGMWYSYVYHSPKYTIEAVIGYDEYTDVEMVERLAIY